MASIVFILDLKGKVIVSRNYRGDIPVSAVEKFMPLLSDLEEDGVTATPVLTHEGISYLYIKHNNLYRKSFTLFNLVRTGKVLALTRKNSNAMTVLLFLHKLAQVFTEYFRTLEEESIRDNFVIVYELLDEMMDFGFPQITETRILQEYSL